MTSLWAVYEAAVMASTGRMDVDTKAPNIPNIPP